MQKVFTTEDQTMSDAVDMAFFLLQRASMVFPLHIVMANLLQRSLLTCSPDCICAIANHIVTVISRDILLVSFP